ncbi:hypothetical protein CCMSSC00406_0002348 [Pleurotus cornucopiae]|uniref:Uncharacterized protein n=1 Tax=Pleurotus cornucopiae TaxID=5321 RepID=A0ACB7J330_PLECO|nr:hypothetical protein CCMSSC00406_0002348 [Pleurotus cornucopiae]
MSRIGIEHDRSDHPFKVAVRFRRLLLKLDVRWFCVRVVQWGRKIGNIQFVLEELFVWCVMEVAPCIRIGNRVANNLKDNGILDGAFQGYLMIRAAKFILIGRSCATSEPGASTGRRGNAALAEINTITPRVIAYIAVQLHFALSSQSTWGLKDRALFDYHKFYWNIVSFFEEDESGGQDILEHYNYHLWGDKSGCSSSAANANGDDHDSDDGDDGFALLVNERAAKRARADPFT